MHDADRVPAEEQVEVSERRTSCSGRTRDPVEEVPAQVEVVGRKETSKQDLRKWDASLGWTWPTPSAVHLGHGERGQQHQAAVGYTLKQGQTISPWVSRVQVGEEVRNGWK